MNYFAFPLKCKKLYKKINGASKLSYKSSNTRSPFLLSITGGSPYKSDGEARLLAQLQALRTLVSLRVARTQSQYFFPYRYRLVQDEFILSSLRLRVKKLYLKKAKRHHILLKYRLLQGPNSTFPTSIPVRIIWESSPTPTPTHTNPGRSVINVTVRQTFRLFQHFFFRKIHFVQKRPHDPKWEVMSQTKPHWSLLIIQVSSTK